VFALCQDADPEACLLLELRGDDDRAAWYYALAPLTSREVKVWHHEDLVWKKAKLGPARDRTQTYYVLGPNATP
jgi:hypothetical protein